MEGHANNTWAFAKHSEYWNEKGVATKQVCQKGIDSFWQICSLQMISLTAI